MLAIVRRASFGDRFVGAQSLGVLALSLAGVVIAIYVTDDLASSPTSVGNRLAVGALFGAICGLLIALGSARTFVRDDTVHVVSLFVTLLIPTAEIVDVEAENGMTIQVASGRRIGSVAFGTSLIAIITGNRRGRRAARRLVAVIGRKTGGHDGWTQDTVQPRPRWAALTMCVVTTGLAMLLSVL